MGMKSKPLDKVRNVPVPAVARESVGRVNINVPLSVRMHWKTAAAQANRPMSDLIVEAMTNYLDGLDGQKES